MESYTTSQRMAWGLGEISEFTGLSVPFLRNEVRAGRLAVRKFGRRILVRDEDLQRYLAEGSPGRPGTKSDEHQTAQKASE